MRKTFVLLTVLLLVVAAFSFAGTVGRTQEGCPSCGDHTTLMGVCSQCSGSGNGPFQCFHCKGTGAIGSFTCTFCKGRGRSPCSGCGGTGQTKDLYPR